MVRVDGYWLPELGPATPPTWSTVADGGCGEASWTIMLPPTARHPAMRRGSLVQVRVGSVNVWSGLLSEPEYSEEGGWSCNAAGLYAEASGFLCLTGGGETTATPNTAIDAAINRGLPWTRWASISSTSFTDGTSDTTDSLNYISDLLNAWANANSVRWGVDGDGFVYARADDTTPTWHMTPRTGTLGQADDDYASAVFLRYYTTSYVLATATAVDQTSSDLYGRKEVIVDGAGYGALTSTKAAAYAQGLLDKGIVRMGWTDTLEPTRYELTTPGGTPASLAMVRAQQVVRLHGLTDDRGAPLPYVDFVIGSTTYNAAEGTLSIAPIGLQPRTLSDVLAVT